MPSVITLSFQLREEGGKGRGLIREGGGLIKNFNLQTGGLLEREGLLELLR